MFVPFFLFFQFLFVCYCGLCVLFCLCFSCSYTPPHPDMLPSRPSCSFCCHAPLTLIPPACFSCSPLILPACSPRDCVCVCVCVCVICFPFLFARSRALCVCVCLHFFVFVYALVLCVCERERERERERARARISPHFFGMPTLFVLSLFLLFVLFFFERSQKLFCACVSVCISVCESADFLLFFFA